MSSHFIEFPALGWKFNISPTIVEFSLFGRDFSLNWYGLLIALGFLLAVIYALRRAKKFDIDPDRMIDVVLVSALFAFVGARLYYVLFSAERADYFEDPLSILYVWEGGLGIYGGIIFAFITGVIMCRVRKVNILAMFDLASLGFLIGQCIGRWGNFFNQEAFGGNTTLPWGMTGDIIQSGVNGSGYTLSEPVHPTFLYESLWCLLGFLLLHFISKKAYKFKGELFSLYIVWYGAGRFFIESLRSDSLYFGAMKVSQLVAALSVAGGVALFFVFRAHARSLPKDLFSPEPALAEGAEESSGTEGTEAMDEADEAIADDEANEAMADLSIKAEDAAAETDAMATAVDAEEISPSGEAAAVAEEAEEVKEAENAEETGDETKKAETAE